MQQMPTIRVLEHGDKPSAGFVRRPRPVYPEFVSHASWWPVQEWERNGQEDMVYLWIPAGDNRAYEKFVPRERFCKTYNRKSVVPPLTSKLFWESLPEYKSCNVGRKD